MRRGWRRFRPRFLARQRTQTPTGDISSQAIAIIEEVGQEYGLSRRRVDIDQLDPLVDELKQRVHSNPSTGLWFALLIAQTPRAARAQVQMDAHPHGYQNQKGRLYELIDFNDTFVSTVLELSDTERREFVETAKRELTRFCKRVGAKMLSDEQFEAITRGLGKEIAVYLGALNQGFQAEMTSRSQDAMGIDIVITDPATGRSLNIDCKTSSAYRYRIKDLVQQGRLTERDAERAEQLGYTHEVNGHNAQAVPVTIMRIDANELGDIENFSFVEPELLAARLRMIFGRL